MVYLFAALFGLAGLACVFAVGVGLPGGWILLALATLIELVDGWLLQDPEFSTFGWWALGAGAVLLLAGELLEIASGMLGSHTGGGSKRGMKGAVAGGLLGAVVGTFVLPVPIVGTLLGSVGGTFVGALVGELTGEDRREWKKAMWPAVGATLGRILGTVAKVGVVMVLSLGLSLAIFMG